MLAICKARAIYIDLFLIGSFITVPSFGFDGRAGRAHDLIFDAAATWLKTLAREACTAIESANSRRPRPNADHIRARSHLDRRQASSSAAQ